MSRSSRWPDDPVTLLLLDVDEFKAVNDSGGHAAGDEVLSALARIFLRAVRADEQAFRIGGDEFAIVIRGDAKAGVRVGERILRAIGVQRRGRTLPTLSAGVAWTDDGPEAKDTLARAAQMGVTNEYVKKARENLSKYLPEEFPYVKDERIGLEYP